MGQRRQFASTASSGVLQIGQANEKSESILHREDEEIAELAQHRQLTGAVIQPNKRTIYTWKAYRKRFVISRWSEHRKPLNAEAAKSGPKGAAHFARRKVGGQKLNSFNIATHVV